MTKITYIPGEIANAAIDEHGNRKPVTRTQHIFDDAKGKSQAEVNKEFGNAIGGLNSQNYVTVASFNALPATGAADTIYRVANWDGSQYDASVYSEYAWNGTQYIHLSTKTQIGEVFDISAYHATGGTLATYSDLNDALNGVNGGVPQSLQKGGMSVKYVDSSDNKYVQYRLMSDTFNTTEANWQGVDDAPTAGSDNLVKSGGVFSKCPTILDDDDIFSIADDGDNKVFRIGSTYFKVGNFILNGIGEEEANSILVFKNGSWVPSSFNELLSLLPESDDLLMYDGTSWTTINKSVFLTAKDAHSYFSIEDENGYKAIELDENSFSLGISKFSTQNRKKGRSYCLNGNEFVLLNSTNPELFEKNLATYGDSITATNNGDYVAPFENLSNWGNQIADYFTMHSQYGRGIGGQSYEWGSGGGSVAFVTPTGLLINRLDNYNYDTWQELNPKVFPSGVTQEMIDGGEAFVVRGCGCSWLRITSMFPTNIKDKIDVLLIQFHNYTGNTEIAPQWIEGSVIDTEWSLSTYYSDFGGDYNISDVRGAIASTIMKLQVWMPQVKIVLLTPISGRGTSGMKNMQLATTMQQIRLAVLETGALVSIPVIDVYATDGINGINRLSYITDSIHPNQAGQKRLAQSVIGGLRNINI